MAKKENMPKEKMGVFSGIDFEEIKKDQPEEVVDKIEKQEYSISVEEKSKDEIEAEETIIEEEIKENAKEENIQNNNENNQNLSISSVFTYTREKKQQKNQKLPLLVTPETNNKLKKLVARKKIKSKNDLINQLLEAYLNSIDI